MAPGTIYDPPLESPAKNELKSLTGHCAADILQWHSECEQILCRNAAIRQAKIINLAERAADPQWTVVLSLWDSNLNHSDVPIILKSARKTLVKEQRSLRRNDLIVPKQWRVIAELPLTTSGSVDERSLRQFLTAPEERRAIQLIQEKVKRIISNFDLTEPPSPVKDGHKFTQMEQILGLLWSQVLNIVPGDIRREDSFFQQGGDSITAIELATLAQDCGIRMTVAAIIQNPRLCDLAAVATLDGPEVQIEVSSFSLLPGINRDELLKQIRRQCGLSNEEAIEDAYPCTPFQEGLMALAIKQPDSFVSRRSYRLPADVNVARFKSAWERTIAKCANLRTRIIIVAGTSTQILIQDDIKWDNLSLEAPMNASDDLNVRYGTRLCRYSLIEEHDGSCHFVWAMHHAIFDGWTVRIILDVLHREYYRDTAGPLDIQPYSRFISYTQALNRSAAGEYWRNQLAGARRASFPPPKAPDFRSEAVRRHTKKTISFPKPRNTSATKASILRAAWAIILGRYCDTEDICFGATLSGRQAPVPGLEMMPGPAVATVPVRIRLDGSQSIADFLRKIQEQAAEMIKYEHFGLREIAKLGPDAKDGCDFSSIMLIQPSLQITPEADFGEPIFKFGDLAEEAMQDFFGYPLLVQVQLQHGDSVGLFFTYDPDFLSEGQAQALSHQFDHVVQQLLEFNNDSPLSTISVAGPWDLKQACDWNKQQGIEEFEHVHDLVHDMISQRSKRTPRSEAIYSSEESMTYGQLDYLSERLALHLRHLGVTVETIVPFCFEKSTWTIVAMLGIMKAGGAFLPIDPSHPAARRQALIDEVAADYLVVSQAQRPTCENMARHIIVLSESLLDSYHQATSLAPLNLSRSSACYVLFTSGSTGKPKGTLVEHGSLCSSLVAQVNAFSMDENSRTFQFASYTFDVSILEIFGTLIAGGTVCVPTDEERLTDTASFIIQARVNVANLTPTMARTIKPEQVPTLKKLYLGGELAQHDLLQAWHDQVEVLINTYGLTEACIWNTSHRITSAKISPRNIGRGFNSYCWIVEPDNHELLAPIGCVGELVLHSYSLARCYLNEPEMTRKVFLDKTEWLPCDLIPCSDRWRFYKTGDLARYLPTGDIEIIGRRDSQVKFRGRRIELNEIEFAIKSLRDDIEHLAVELISLKERDTLVAFVSFQAERASETKTQTPIQHKSPALGISDNYSRTTVSAVSKGLKNILPAYMVPSLFLPVTSMPFTASLKIDRKSLHAMAQCLSKDSISQFQFTDQEKLSPTTAMELQLQRLWARILKVQPEEIGKNDNFLQIGGDSISAIELSSLAQESEIELPVASIFQAPRLCDMAVAAFPQTKATSQLQRFSLLPNDEVDDIIREVCHKCTLKDSRDIEDIYPCSALQEGLMGLAIKDRGSYLARRAFLLPIDIDVERFRLAWEETVRLCANLRTRVVMVGTLSLQVVIKDDVRWEQFDNSADPASCFAGVETAYGSPLCHYGLVQKTDTTEHYFILSIHHAIYDGWTIRLLMDVLHRAYDGETAFPLQPYSRFIDSATSIDMDAASKYWQSQLLDAKRAVFPPSSPASKSTAVATLSQGTRHLKRRVALPHSATSSITKASILRAAWAIILARYCDSDDVCFGATVSGRQASIPGLGMMAGPTIATVPVRVRIDRQQTVARFCQAIQMQASEMIHYEQFGLRNISRVSEHARDACNFTSRLIIQPSAQLAPRNGASKILQVKGLVDEAIDVFSNDPLLVQLGISGDEVDIMITYDVNVLTEAEIEALSWQFEHVAKQLAAQDEKLLDTISVSGPWDLEKTRLWNSEVQVVNVQACIHDLVTAQVKRTPDQEAIYSTDRTMTYLELDRFSTVFAKHLRKLGVGLETVVPFCFEKSIWTIVAMMGILKAGGVFLPLDPSNPLARRKGLVDEVGARVVVVSPRQEASCDSLAQQTVVVLSEKLLLQLSIIPGYETEVLCVVSPSNNAYIFFTSGSTGKPKGIVVQHSAVALSLVAHAKLFDIGGETRVLEFAHYVYDVNVFNIFGSLISGCTICVPTEEERLYTTAAFMEQAGVNMACFAPSFARTIDPNQVPSLRKMVLGGEALAKDVQEMWCERVKLFNAYGPTEAAISCTSFTVETTTTTPNIIGKGFACDCYVVDTDNHHRLAPIGCVGELILHGNNIARGYVNNEEITRAVFLDSVHFMPKRQPGDIRKFYKTGDLVKYTPDGDLLYLGRKDTQVKIRGRRIEIGEIETNLKTALPGVDHVAVDLIDLKTRQALVAFICFPAESTVENSVEQILAVDQGPLLTMTAALRSMISKAIVDMKIVLPSYMVPSIFIPMRSFPFLSSLKLDRKRLRAIPEQLSSKQLSLFSLATRDKVPASTTMELSIRKFWSKILKVNPKDIGKHDSFLEIGGDSISAIQLVSLAQEHGVQISVANVFEAPQLDRLALVAKKMSENTESLHMEPFSLLPEAKADNAAAEACHQCEVPGLQAIEDMFPCTPLQEGLMALAERKPGSYVAKQIYRVPSHVDIERFRAAWNMTVETCSILRTRIAWIDDRFYQVLLKEPVHLDSVKAASPRAVLTGMERQPMRYGSSLCRYDLVEENGSFYFVVMMHHATFDGWTIDIVLNTLYQAYHGQQLPPTAPYANFIRHIHILDFNAATEYWAAQLHGAEKATFPILQSSGHDPGRTALMKRRIPLNGGVHATITKATILRAAWAIVLARYCNTQDICFGATVSGRLASVKGISNMAGPTISTVPVRVRINGRQVVSSFLHDIQKQSTEMVAFEQMGLREISKVGGFAKAACDFTSLFLVQPSHQSRVFDSGDDAILEHLESEELMTLESADSYFNFPLVLQCYLHEAHAELRLSYQSNVLSEFRMEALANHFDHVVQQLLAQDDAPLSKISVSGPWDLQILKQWSSISVQGVDIGMGDLPSERLVRSASSIYWIVNSNNPQTLAPIGCQGELMILEPRLPQSPFKATDDENPHATSFARVEWLSSADMDSCQLYKTGHLARYEKGGTIVLVEKSSSQMKDQRKHLQLSEIERYIKQACPAVQNVAADIIHLDHTDHTESPAAFISLSSDENYIDSGLMLPLSAPIREVLCRIYDSLESYLPSHMMPEAIIPLRQIPLRETGELDLDSLRAIIKTLSPEQLLLCSPLSRTKATAPTTMELKLRELWAEVLGLDPNEISKDDSFLHIGGDSISAIQLVSLAQRQGLNLTVPMVFQNPRLMGMAESAAGAPEETTFQTEPFSLFEASEIDTLKSCIQSQCSLFDTQVIEDAYPCTPLQEGLMALTVKQPGSYISSNVYRIVRHVNIAQFKWAWERTVAACSNLRTRISLVFGRSIQAIIKEEVKWEASLDNFKAGYGLPLCRFALTTDKNEDHMFAIAMHHAIYDAWSIQIMLDTFMRVYRGNELPCVQPYAGFIKFTLSLDHAAAARYWTNYLEDAKRATFPPARPLSCATHKVVTRLLNHHISLPQLTSTSVTKATVVRAAWAIVLARYCETDDLCFGTTVSGRLAPVPGLDAMPGPMIATIPVRIRLDRSQPVTEFLEMLQLQSSEAVAYEQFGLQNISKLNREAQTTCDFTSLLIVQPSNIGFADTSNDTLFLPSDSASASREDAVQNYFNYPLVLQVFISDDGVELLFAYDSEVLSNWQVEALSHQLEHVLHKLTQPGVVLEDVSLVGPWDLEHAIRSNRLQQPINSCTHWLINDQIQHRPNDPAVNSWDCDLTYAELGVFASRLAITLQERGVGPESLVPVCFSKSAWAVVAMVAVQISGGVVVPLDPNAPKKRLQSILQDTKPPLVLTAPACFDSLQSMGFPVLSVDEQSLKAMHHPSVQLRSEACPENLSVILFTSGSTGKPKGVMIPHNSISSSANAYGSQMGIGPGTRVFQFSSYAFDVAILDIFVTLIRGGCICVPSEEARLHNLAGAINATKANWIFLTPTVAGLLHPNDVPGLKKLCLGGEAVGEAVIRRWKGAVRLYGGYGPAEASICSWNSDLSGCSRSTNIGRPLFSAFWVVETSDVKRLAPTGCVGELVIQGPLLARGYLNADENASSNWLEDVDWFPENISKRAYRTGDLVRRNGDGTFDYVGRKDSQIKYHGQRMEPGEIEHHIAASLKDVEHVAVDVIRHGAVESLAAFVSLREAGSRSSLSNAAASLIEVLPAPMIPKYFVPIERMPFTVSGKLDRLALREKAAAMTPNQLFSYSSSQRSEFRDCSTDLEAAIRRHWSEVLDMSETSIGVDDNFYHLGGDSIRIVTLAQRILQAYGVGLGLSLINSKNTTIAAMAKLIHATQTGMEWKTAPSVDLMAEYSSMVNGAWDLQNLAQHPITRIPERASVFLTGATGYLGTEILRQLLRADSVDLVVVLVRAASPQHGLERVKRTAEVAGWWQPSDVQKLELWTGDLAKAYLGLDNDQLLRLRGQCSRHANIDAIIHNGAVVNWNADYYKLREPNVSSTLDLLRVVSSSPVRPKFVYISGGLKETDGDQFATLAAKLSGASGYAQTKIMAERVVLEIASRLPSDQNRISVVKPGLIIGTAETGVANVDDFLWRAVATGIALKAAPVDGDDSWVHVAEVDHVASTITRQIFAVGSVPAMVDMLDGVYMSQFWSLVGQELALDLSALPLEEWVQRATKQMNEVGENHPLWAARHFLTSPDAPSQRPMGYEDSEKTKVAIRRNVRYLARIGFIQRDAKNFGAVEGSSIGRSKLESS